MEKVQQVLTAIQWLAANSSIIVAYLLELVGACSLIVAALTPLVKLTNWDKDDAAVGFIGRGLDFIHAFLSKLALNPSEKNAR